MSAVIWIIFVVMFLIFIKLSNKCGVSCRDNINYLLKLMVKVILCLRKCVLGSYEGSLMADRGEQELGEEECEG